MASTVPAKKFGFAFIAGRNSNDGNTRSHCVIGWRPENVYDNQEFRKNDHLQMREKRRIAFRLFETKATIIAPVAEYNWTLGGREIET